MDNNSSSLLKKRLINLSIFLSLFLIEVLIALFVRDNFIRPYVGDVIVTVLICYFARIFFPVGLKLLPLYVFAFAAAIELAQLAGITEMISGDSRFLRIILGTSFSVWDILCYAVGCIIVGVIEIIGRQRARKKV